MSTIIDPKVLLLTCPICSLPTVDLGFFITHCESHSDRGFEVKILSCVECGAKTNQQTFLEEHIRLYHSSGLPVSIRVSSVHMFPSNEFIAPKFEPTTHALVHHNGVHSITNSLNSSYTNSYTNSNSNYRPLLQPLRGPNLSLTSSAGPPNMIPSTSQLNSNGSTSSSQPPVDQLLGTPPTKQMTARMHTSARPIRSRSLQIQATTTTSHYMQDVDIDRCDENYQSEPRSSNSPQIVNFYQVYSTKLNDDTLNNYQSDQEQYENGSLIEEKTDPAVIIRPERPMIRSKRRPRAKKARNNRQKRRNNYIKKEKTQFKISSNMGAGQHPKLEEKIVANGNDNRSIYRPYGKMKPESASSYCKTCDKTFLSSRGLTIHKLNIHSKTAKTNAKKPKLKTKLPVYSRLAAGGKKIKEPLPNKENKNSPSKTSSLIMNNSLTPAASDEIYQCEFCTRQFSNRKGLASHCKVHVRRTRNSLDEIFGQLLTDSFPENEFFNPKPSKIAKYSTPEQNNDSETSSELIQCPQCDRSFSHGKGLLIHFTKCHGGQPTHARASASQEPSTSQDLTPPELSPDGNAEINTTGAGSDIAIEMFCEASHCDVCMTDFGSVSKLLSHKYHDHGIKPAHCRYCDEVFIGPECFDKLNNHLTINHQSIYTNNFEMQDESKLIRVTGLKPSQCSKCFRFFAKKLAMVSHMRKEHKAYKDIDVKAEELSMVGSEINFEMEPVIP